MLDEVKKIECVVTTTTEMTERHFITHNNKTNKCSWHQIKWTIMPLV